MPTIKINRWDSEQVHYLCDKEDKMDMCLYVDGEKIKIEPSKSEESDDWVEHTFEIGEDVSEELGAGKHTASIRVNGKWVETLKIIITNPEDNEESDED